MTDLVSVIIPVYKVEDYIHECVDSVINQSYKNLEIILVDDGSPDNCPKICDEYAKKDKRIKVIHKKNGGLSDARNAGIDKCHGKYITFVDSDDWINSELVDSLMTLIKKHNADIAICGHQRISDSSEIKKQKKEKEFVYDKDTFLKKYFKIGSQTTEYYAWGKLYKSELLDGSQYPVGLTSEDVLGTYKAILKSTKIAETTNEYYYYRYNSSSITGRFSEKDFDLIDIWDRVVELSKDTPYIDYAVINRKRIDFTLLYRMAQNYSVKELKNNKRVKKILSDLKSNKKMLLKSGIDFKRKIAIALFSANYYFFSIFIKKDRND